MFAKLFIAVFFYTICAEANVSQENKICLTMIVKNESTIIERLLNSVKDVVDCVSICDTGSQDNTVELIESFLKTNGIPGKVHREPWRNFGYNRTLSAKLAKQTLQDLKFPLDRTYLLFLDADMVLKMDPAFDKQALQADSYLVVQRNSIISYDNTRLARASLDWESVGVTHEYWASKQPSSSDRLRLLWIDDREDGGCKSDKLERDVRLLTQGIKEEPNNERYYFYLAQSYKDMGNLDEAIKWYKARIEKGGWFEEVWYAKFVLGEIYKAKNDWDQALHWYLDAYQYNPDRAEPLCAIANYYRLKGDKQLAYIFAKQGSQIPYPKDQSLFIFDAVYDYMFDEELSIVADATRFKEEGYAAANRLLLKKNVPQAIKEQTLRNMQFYVENVKSTEFVPFNFQLPKPS